MELEWVLGNDNGAPIYFLTQSNIDMYIQPGGCLEFGQTDDNGEREFIHFCPDMFSAILTAVEMAKAKVSEG